jgi:hypothetical protein
MLSGGNDYFILKARTTHLALPPEGNQLRVRELGAAFLSGAFLAMWADGVASSRAAR